MLGRGLVLCLFLYVGLDFSNPLMPGAVTFDAGESIEGVRADRRVEPPPAVVEPFGSAERLTHQVPLVVVSRPLPDRSQRRAWLVPGPRTLERSRDAGPPGDDH